MFNFLKKSSIELYSPASGKSVCIEDVPDKIFSEKMLGDGFAVLPNDNKIYAPIGGTVTMIANTKHAIGIKTKSGIEVLIHIGLDTVNYMGKGFKLNVKQGDNIKRGEFIVEFDKDFFEKENVNTVTMVVITNSNEFNITKLPMNEFISRDDIILKCQKKNN